MKFKFKYKFKRKWHSCLQSFSYTTGLILYSKIPSYQHGKFHCGDKAVVRLSHLHNGISHTGKRTSEGKARLTTYSYLGGGHRQDMVPPYSHGQYWTVDVHPPELSIWHSSVRTTQLSIRRVSVWQQHAVWNGYHVSCTHWGQATDLYVSWICHHPFREWLATFLGAKPLFEPMQAYCK